MSARRLISSGSPFETACGYSRAVCDGEFVFISGTTGYDYATMAMPDDVAAQARNIYATFASVLAEAGGGLENIVSLRTFVTSADYCVPVLDGSGRGLRRDPARGGDLCDRGVAQKPK